MKLWNEFLHNCLAHPLLFLTRGAQWAERFHDRTGAKAWPEGDAT